MKTAALNLLLIVAASANAQFLPSASTSARSVSGQFIVLAAQPASPAWRARPVSTNINYVQLEPTLVAISAERVKQAVWRELGVTGPWQQKIKVVLYSARTDNEPVTLDMGRSPSGWTCRVEMPDQLPKERYLRVLVQAILLELANRNADERPAELPTWLVEGLAYQLLANHSAELVIAPPRLTANGVTYNPTSMDFRRISLLEMAHKTLLGETPLSFEELCWPAPGQMDGPDGARYRACAQLFTHKLLNLRGGPACMRNFLGVLPAYLNWQIAFLEGFSPHFTRPLDIEKWWTLQSTGFISRDLIQTWTYEESWNRLAASLLKSVDVFAGTNDLPVRSEVNLQTVLRDWKPADQVPVLRDKAAELESLRLRIAPELAALTAEYRQVIETYLNRREPPPSGGRLNLRATGSAAQRAQRAAVQHLDQLDARLARMSPKSAPTISALPPNR